MTFLVLRQAPLLLLIWLLAVSTAVSAQNSPTSPPQENAPKESTNSTGVYTGREIYVPKVPEEKEPEPSARSFADGFLRNTRRHLGFSVTASESYSPNLVTTPE